MPELSPEVLGWVVMAIPIAPLAACVLLGSWIFVVGPLGERAAARVVIASLWVSLGCLVTAGVATADVAARSVDVGTWFEIDAYQFETGFLLDRLSLTFAAAQLVVAMLVARFAVRYMHNEPGFARFFALLALAVSGLTCVVLAHSYDLLFAGWEAVGLSSVLLVAFFHDRQGPVTAALVLLTTYRTADVGILLGCVTLHALFGNTLYATVLAEHAPGLEGGTLVLVGLLFLLSAMGKSAQFPLGGWLPRAMEGPTPSSALFYGALAIHAGVYLLLRSAPLIERSTILGAVIVAVGALTAVHGAVVGRVQPDVKSQLAYATMTQLGVIFVEIGAGLTTLALFHVVAHATLRTYQLLRAPNALADAHRIRAALGSGGATAHASPLESLLSPASRRRVYRLALDRFHADTVIERFCVQPIRRLATLIATREERFVDRFRSVPPPAPPPSVVASRTLSTDGGAP